ncbi:MAG: Valine-tRNA ligase [Microgenomates group bacterium GW2011_GWC2_46_7]|nr:MAG: Valine-tRNA ligase [Microgenomates group bacterium GW2011_GWC2_46_7]
MEKTFEHQKVERDIYNHWEQGGFFASKKGLQPYTILMPPPNANASLHAGHGMYAVDDILIRWKRMQGYSCEWIPGRDHAGFETQFVYEKQLAKEGKSRTDFDRKTLYDKIAKFVEENSGLIFEQFRRLGFSADWSRSVFTLDPQVLSTVYTTFARMVKDDLVYRSDYLVNYCPHCGTSLAELEIKHDEREDKLYYIKYGPLTVATVRPETMFGDSGLVVHPKDKRYSTFVGTEVELPLTTRKIPVIEDEMVDREFGTGVVKITPAHDPNDFEAGKRHNLQVIRVIDQLGRMTLPQDATVEEINGMKVKAARERTVEELQKMGAIERVDEHYLHAVTVCYKCNRDMEPMTVPNWYIKVEPLKPAVIEAVKAKKTQFYPKKFEKQILDWMAIMHDWPISRQVAWGIRIPAWYSATENKDLYVTFLDKDRKPVSGKMGELLKTYDLTEIEAGLQTLSAPTEAKYVVSQDKPGDDYLQETDTFDTWFSSGQWPLVTLKEDEYATRYPTDVMATMSDILKFWVSRMMMFGLYIRGEVPFKNVYLWSTVTDGKGAKMSKSKGNVINPIELVDKYGADALRMSLLFGNGEGGRVPLSEDKVRAMRNFANKIWNMARFYLMMAGEKEVPWYDLKMKDLKVEDKKIIKELNAVITKITSLLEKFRFAEAADTIYEFMWHQVADVYIEQVKAREDKTVALSVLRHVLLTGLKLLHPFMPFVTEAIWKEMPKKYGEMLIVSKWPTVK